MPTPTPQATIVVGYDETTGEFTFSPQRPMGPWKWDASDDSISPKPGQADAAKCFAFQAASGWLLAGFRVGPNESQVDDHDDGNWYNATGYLGPQCLTVYGENANGDDAYETLVVEETNRPPQDQNPSQSFYYCIRLVPAGGDGSGGYWDDPKIYEKPAD